MRKNKKDVPVVTRFNVFLDFALVDGTASPPTSEPICRLEFDICAGEKCPKASENFRQLVSGPVTVGEKRNARQAQYKGTRMLRCTSEALQCGDTNPLASTDGKTQDTIFGALIEDEALGVVPHTFGTLSLVNSGPNTNGSQFFVVAGEDAPTFPHLDSRHVSLGFLRGGEEAKQGLRKLHELSCSLALDRTGTMPNKGDGAHIVISDCGVVSE